MYREGGKRKFKESDVKMKEERDYKSSTTKERNHCTSGKALGPDMLFQFCTVGVRNALCSCAYLLLQHRALSIAAATPTEMSKKEEEKERKGRCYGVLINF